VFRSIISREGRKRGGPASKLRQISDPALRVCNLTKSEFDQLHAAGL